VRNMRCTAGQEGQGGPQHKHMCALLMGTGLAAACGHKEQLTIQKP
jgi:hypothetical protein